jgi:radical SAM superfamily enzyme
MSSFAPNELKRAADYMQFTSYTTTYASVRTLEKRFQMFQPNRNVKAIARSGDTDSIPRLVCATAVATMPIIPVSVSSGQPTFDSLIAYGYYTTWSS